MGLDLCHAGYNNYTNSDLEQENKKEKNPQQKAVVVSKNRALL